MADEGIDEKKLPAQPHWYETIHDKVSEEIGDGGWGEIIIDTGKDEIAEALEKLRNPRLPKPASTSGAGPSSQTAQAASPPNDPAEAGSSSAP